jgi:hypothetical protein
MKARGLPRTRPVAKAGLLTGLLAGLLAGLLSGCATPPAPDRGAERPYCHKTAKGRVLACTQAAAPSLDAEAKAKRFTPDPHALTVYVVRRNWGDGRHLVEVQADAGPAVQTLPDTLVRLKLAPGRHTLALSFDGRRQATTVEGRAGDLRFARIEGRVWSWASRFAWVTEPEAATRERALAARLVADVVAR